ncbi:SufE family protein [Gammaproteobacteria bacterium]|jgi:cysteine desulfuration protein SufE|nr:SufE family protein [Gammaproteobacteria bacterium]MDG2236781.1 SufE family protein [Arenicellales bacterium]
MESFPINYERVIETFDFLNDWDARYHFITELGEKLPVFPDSHRVEAYLVPECMSTVFIQAIRDPQGRYTFRGDCDTSTVKGVVAILLAMFHGQTAQEIADFDADAGFERLGLFDHLSPTRHVGVYAMVQRVKRQVTALEAGES